MKIVVKILKKPVTSTFIAIFFGFIVASIVLGVAGYNPIDAFSALFGGIFSKPKYISNTIIKATPIILTGLSVAFAFKTGLFNIGAEGQYIVGTIASTIVGIKLNLPAVLQIPLVILAGVAAGAVFGGIVGILKAKFGIHEVITSIMLNWIALYLSNFVVSTDVFHQPDSTSTYMINESGFTTILGNWKTSDAGMEFLSHHKWLSEVLLKTDVNIGIIVAIIMAVVISILLYKSAKGYELRAVGLNKDAAEFAGINVNRNIVQSMVIAGALSGLAGALAITGTAPHKLSTMAAFENNGFNGLSVALIAGSSPIGCIFGGLLYGGLLYGGQSVQSAIGAPSEIINIMIGTIVFFVALTKIVPALADRLLKRGEKNVK
ncbi:ABC transporter permease [Clostridium beijerinckii]|uniref:Simple sugar transport system permease protein n=4 Tax=Clostridium beijerinckii TaxID=1520 RepID=A0AAE5H4T2_CLOBE|nr:ABC transporter permease [Clostridium beijerinckii]MBA8934385.1 simple sugar transport system permease protein [Clostridium beijerinckii]NRT35728.1 simple sugar transport system permease protein [Clostridium beijerinckii]NRT44844.1 simple sugar transport system permease protein [Clostridium beijerinckii]NRT72384.1 simple sugar transport system permease protein [Clostridium beijerinckii]NRT86897.1 simple sugar transport system permease protein [Clostridium beijerinckii]